ncbi:MAG TPA: hypothetical protein VFG50_02065 [Rhodothermales bacterium]|nr:hypothetical protein [Rhodothermales bacterium]
MNEEVPLLSVVVASTHASGHVERCLDVLRSQVQGRRVEIILAGAFTPDQESKFDDICFIPFPEATPGPVLWGAGIARARGEQIAVTDTLTLFDAGWVDAALCACTPERPIAGGAVEPLPVQSLVNWAAYFCDYGQFMRPLQGGTSRELPGTNVTFKRTLLEHASAYTQPSFWKTYWCRALAADGVPLTSVPSMVAFHAKEYRLGSLLLRRYRHGRCFGGMRNEQLSVGRRVAYLAGSPLLPVLFLLRMTRTFLPKRRFRRQFFASLPFSVLALASWSIGEAFGYLAGPGDSCQFVY